MLWFFNMRFEFSYDLEKDIDNYLITSKSINNPTPTRSQQEYIEQFGSEFNRDNLRSFIQERIKKYGLDSSTEAERMKRGWEPLQEHFLERSLKMFHLDDSDELINIYLTTDQRCSYNIANGYFFISFTRVSDNQNKTIMHELFHFWTWRLFHERVESGEISKSAYNAIKESLTALLNIEFNDLLNGVIDNGYPQHGDIREVVADTWIKTKDIIATFDAGLEIAKMKF